MQQVWITKVGPPETLELKQAPDPEPGPGEARIRVKASGINFADIMARLGLYPDSPKLPAVVGYEVSGEIDRVGAEVKLKPGDKVIGLCRFGGYSDTVVLPEKQIYPLPDGMTFAQGAALPVNYLTVYQMLFVMGAVKRGDRVLVHSAAGGIGLAALDLCKVAGAGIIGTASKAKHDYLRSRGIDQLIDSRNEDFEKEVMRITNGKGVHLILDPVGGESWAKGLRILAPTGRLVVFGFSSLASRKRGRSVLSAVKGLLAVPWMKVNPISLMNSNHGVLGVNLGHLWREQEMVHGWATQLLEWYREEKIHPTVDKEFPLKEAARAHHYIQDRKNIGKVVLVP